MLTAKGSETISLYPLGLLAIPKYTHLQKLTDSKSKYKNVLRTHKNIFSRNAATKNKVAFIIFREATQERQSALHKIETYLLLCLIRIIGRRSSSPAAAHDCDLYF